MRTLPTFEMAIAAFEDGDYARARTIFELLESEHLGRGHLYLGWMCDQGLGGPEDAAKAEHHYRCVVEAGELDGKYYLAASLQRRGEIQSAAALYEEAADSGQVSAAYWAYSLYSNELSHTVEAQEKAQKYLVKACELGHLFAQRDFALQVATGAGNFRQRLLARLRSLACKVKGIILILKNFEDLRVR